MQAHNTAAAPVVKEVVLKAPAERVWQAITDPEDMRHWYFDLKEFRAEVGFEFQFWGGTEEKPYLHLCKVTEVVPGRKLAYSWRYEGYAGQSRVTFELFGQGDQTRLVLTHEGLETFPAEAPDLARENFAAGWNEILGTSLKNYVEKA